MSLPKYRPITKPILGQQLAEALNRIEELEKAISTRSLIAPGGVFGGSSGQATGQQGPLIQTGGASTGSDGKIHVTFSQAYGSAPIVLVGVNNSGTEQFAVAVESITATGFVASVGKIALANTGDVWTDQTSAHNHQPGIYAVNDPGGAGTWPVTGNSADESGHGHHVPVMTHGHGRTLVQGIWVYWLAIPATQ
jgi:hypothetical protein